MTDKNVQGFVLILGEMLGLLALFVYGRYRQRQSIEAATKQETREPPSAG